jgi:hypothetical protein
LACAVRINFSEGVAHSGAGHVHDQSELPHGQGQRGQNQMVRDIEDIPQPRVIGSRRQHALDRKEPQAGSEDDDQQLPDPEGGAHRA